MFIKFQMGPYWNVFLTLLHVLLSIQWFVWLFRKFTTEILDDKLLFWCDCIWFLEATTWKIVIWWLFSSRSNNMVIWRPWCCLNLFLVTFNPISHSSFSWISCLLLYFIICSIVRTRSRCHICPLFLFVPKNILFTLCKWKFWHVFFS